jgi:hypothetical protein
MCSSTVQHTLYHVSLCIALLPILGIIIIIINIIIIIIITTIVVIVAKLTDVFCSGHLHIPDRKLCVRCHDVTIEALFLTLVDWDR